MENKLTIKHLSCYLPYGLAVIGENGMYTLTGLSTKIRVAYLENHKSTNGGLKMWLLDVNHWRNVEQGYNPQIYKPILRPLSDLTDKECYKNFKCSSEIQILFDWKNLGLGSVEDLPYKVFNKLIELHFDVFDLIPNNLAIDINTLEK